MERLVGIWAPSYGYVSFNYEADHRLAQVTDSRGSKSLIYAWSPGGLLNSLTDSDGRITTYLYDPVGRLAAITAPNNDTVNLRFDAAGRLTQKRLPNGVSSTYQYNPDNSLAQVVNRTATGAVSRPRVRGTFSTSGAPFFPPV